MSGAEPPQETPSGAASMAHVRRMMEQLGDTDPDAWADYVAEGLAWEKARPGSTLSEAYSLRTSCGSPCLELDCGSMLPSGL